MSEWVEYGERGIVTALELMQDRRSSGNNAADGRVMSG